MIDDILHRFSLTYLNMFLSNNSLDDVMMCVMTVSMTLKQGIRGDSRKKKRAGV